MIYLHNTLFPCRRDYEPKEKDLSILKGKEIEAVKFNEGWGLFTGRKKYWVGKDELGQVKKIASSYSEFNPGLVAGKTWHALSPLELEIELSRQCNQRCIHCWNESMAKGGSLDKKILKDTIRTFRKYGGQRILATGGEPLMYSDFEEIIEFSKEEGIKNLNLVTNGLLIDKKRANMLSKYFDTVNISIHGNNLKVHDYITQKEGSFNKVQRAVRNLRDLGINILIYFSVMEPNFESIPKMFDLVREWDCAGIRFKTLNQCGRGMNLKPMNPQGKAMLRDYIERKAESTGVKVITSELFQKEYGGDPGYFKFYGCNAMRTLLYLQSNGNLQSCNMLWDVIGNIHENNIYDLWISEESKKFRDDRQCRPTEPVCEGCGGGCKTIIK